MNRTPTDPRFRPFRCASRTMARCVAAGTIGVLAFGSALPANAGTSASAGHASESSIAGARQLDPIAIADIAPASTWLLVRIDNWVNARESYDRSYIGRMFKDPRFKSWTKSMLDDLFAGESDAIGSFSDLTEWLKDLDIDLEEIGQPTGPVGIAMYADDQKQGDDDADSPSAAVMLLADFGVNADKLAAAIAEAVEDLEDRERIETDDEQYRGVTINTITVLRDDDDDDDADDDDFMMWMNDEPALPFGLDKIDTFYWARLANTFVVTTRMEAMESAIDRASGDNINNLANQPDLADSLAQHRATHDTFVLLRMVPQFRESIRDGIGGPAMFFLGGMDSSNLIQALGLNEVRAFSAAVHLETADGANETSIGVLMNTRRGLFNLIDEPVTRFDPPAFVGPDTAAVGMLTVRFDRVWPLIETVIGTFPQEDREQAQAGLMMAQGIAKPILDNLGPDMYIINTVERPISAKSNKRLFAIRARDINPIGNALNGFAGMIGLEAREFQGFQVFDPPGEMMGAGPSIGLGGDFVLIGEAADVERGLRGIAEPGNARLANEPAFTAAIAKLDNRGTSFAYDNTRQTLAWTFWQLRNADKIWEEQMRSAGINIEENPWLAGMKPEVPEWTSKLPDISAFLEFMGDNVFEFRPTPDGFRARVLLLPPKRDN